MIWMIWTEQVAFTDRPANIRGTISLHRRKYSRSTLLIETDLTSGMNASASSGEAIVIVCFTPYTLLVQPIYRQLSRRFCFYYAMFVPLFLLRFDTAARESTLCTYRPNHR